MTSVLPKLKMSKTLTVQALMPEIFVRCPMTSPSGSFQRVFANPRLELNHRASSWIVRVFVLDNPVFVKLCARNARIFEV
jgi:hypothetical protein